MRVLNQLIGGLACLSVAFSIVAMLVVMWFVHPVLFFLTIGLGYVQGTASGF